ncbi:LysR family transcriptional regulator [Brevibacterium yomogidense]|uniref:LysR family transcriptional regulator n=1 Tax=Brevibacterium yomogidense TaxID=946573 RepID=UPI0018DFAD62|nr:LysR family transcriptional regulator [Brevibacterium yomogidense]
MTQGSRVDDFRFFSAVASSRSLTEAGRTLGMSVSAVSRRLSAVEHELGVNLVIRNPRSLVLTAEGKQLAEGARKLTADADALEDGIRRASREVVGPVTVRCTLGFGREHVAPVIADFQALHPEVSVFLELSSEPVDLSTATFDLMVSVGKPKDSNLTYRRLVSNRRVICASPEYVAHYGAPQVPADLRDHRCLLLDQHDVNFNRWEFVIDGAVEGMTVDGDLRCNDGDVVVQWCLEGRGIMLRSLWQVADHLTSGSLVQLLTAVPTVDADVYILRPRSSHLSARARALAEYLISEVPQRILIN